MTHEELYDKLVAIFERRVKQSGAPRGQLDAMKAKGPGHLREFAQPLLDTLPAAPFKPTGYCDYVVAGRSFCLNNLVEDECADLGGTFHVNQTCPSPPGPWSTSA